MARTGLMNKQLEVLEGFQERFKVCPRNERTTMIAKAVRALKAVIPPPGIDKCEEKALKKVLSHCITTTKSDQDFYHQRAKIWLYNYRHRRVKKGLATGKKFTWRHVAAYTYKDELEDIITELSGARSGNQDYLSSYQARL